MTRIVRSKLAKPRQIIGLIERPSLLERLVRPGSIRVVLIQSPAGYGKTTLLQQINTSLDRDGVASGWLTLDESDDDPIRFFTYLNAVVDSALGLPAGSANDRINDDDPVRGARYGVIEDLLNRLASLDRRIAIFVDDFQVIRSDTILAVMRRFTALLPPTVTLYIASRSIPPLELSRMLVRDEALVIRSGDLTFTRAEATEFFAADGTQRTDPELIDELFLRTEGWPAVMQLARLAARSTESSRALDALWSAGEAAIEEYLADNVLSSQPENVREFLLKTSILKTMTPDLANELTGIDNADAILDHLEKSGFFVRRIDDERRKYQVHALFAAYLARQLALREEGETRTLRFRAMAWYRERGQLEDAIYQAVAAGDFATAAAILEDWADPLVREAKLATVERWLNLLPIEEVLRRPRLQMRTLWALNYLRRFNKSRVLLEALMEWLGTNEVSGADRRSVALVLAGYHINRDDIGEVSKIALNIDLDVVPGNEYESFELGVAANVQSFYLIATGEFEKAREKARIGKRASRNAVFSDAYAYALLGKAYFAEGRLNEALTQYAEGYEVARRTRGSYASAVVAAGYAEALYYENSLDDARALLSDALPLIRQTCIPDLLAAAHVTYAKILLLDGDPAAANRALELAEAIGLEADLPRVVKTIQWEKVRQHLCQSKVASARKLADTIRFAPARRLPEGPVGYGEDLDGNDVGLARLLIGEGRHDDALGVLGPVIKQAKRSERVLRQIKLKVLKCIALNASGESDTALRGCVEVLQTLAPTGCIRLLLEEDGAQSLLRLIESAYLDVQSRHPSLDLDFVARLSPWTPSDGAMQQPITEPGKDHLTGRQIGILQMLIKGLSNKDIASCLFISENTVKFHLKTIYTKLNVSNRTEASNIASKMGLIPEQK